MNDAHCYCDACENRLDTEYRCVRCDGYLEPCESYPVCVAALCYPCGDLYNHPCVGSE